MDAVEDALIELDRVVCGTKRAKTRSRQPAPTG
jgi:hypothetical protein